MACIQPFWHHSSTPSISLHLHADFPVRNEGASGVVWGSGRVRWGQAECCMGRDAEESWYEHIHGINGRSFTASDVFILQLGKLYPKLSPDSSPFLSLEAPSCKPFASHSSRYSSSRKPLSHYSRTHSSYVVMVTHRDRWTPIQGLVQCQD